jgi:hypothetical protein
MTLKKETELMKKIVCQSLNLVTGKFGTNKQGINVPDVSWVETKLCHVILDASFFAVTNLFEEEIKNICSENDFKYILLIL